MQFVTTRVGGGSGGPLLRDGTGRGVRSDVAGRSLSLYNEVPEEELTLDEFELFALDRLALLRGMENLKTRGYEGKELHDRLQAVRLLFRDNRGDSLTHFPSPPPLPTLSLPTHPPFQLETKYMPLRAHQALEKDGRSEDQRKDLISHFILRIAYCRTEELRRWYLEKECQLLRFRLEKLSDLERSQVMAANGLEYEMVSEEEKTARKDKLVGVSGVTEATFYGSASTFYKVPYTQALSLVSSRGVYIEKGMAYVPMAKLMAIISSKFRINLSKALVDASSMFDHVSSDPRIGPLLKNVHKQVGFLQFQCPCIG